MSVITDHSSNLPTTFTVCPCCGKRGVYKYGHSWAYSTMYGGDYLIRCRYCKSASYGYYTESLEDAAKRLRSEP